MHQLSLLFFTLTEEFLSPWYNDNNTTGGANGTGSETVLIHRQRFSATTQLRLQQTPANQITLFSASVLSANKLTVSTKMLTWNVPLRLFRSVDSTCELKWSPTLDISHLFLWLKGPRNISPSFTERIKGAAPGVLFKALGLVWATALRAPV